MPYKSPLLLGLLLVNLLHVHFVGVLHAVDQLPLLVLYVYLGPVEYSSHLRPVHSNLAKYLFLKCELSLLGHHLVLQLGHYHLLLVSVQPLLKRLVSTVQYCNDFFSIDVDWTKYFLERGRRLAIDHVEYQKSVGSQALLQPPYEVFRNEYIWRRRLSISAAVNVEYNDFVLWWLLSCLEYELQGVVLKYSESIVLLQLKVSLCYLDDSRINFDSRDVKSWEVIVQISGEDARPSSEHQYPTLFQSLRIGQQREPSNDCWLVSVLLQVLIVKSDISSCLFGHQQVLAESLVLFLQVLLLGVGLAVVGQLELALHEAYNLREQQPPIIAVVNSDFFDDVVLVFVVVGPLSQLVAISYVWHIPWLAPFRKQLSDRWAEFLLHHFECSEYVATQELDKNETTAWDLVVKHPQPAFGVVQKGVFLPLGNDEYYARVLLQKLVGGRVHDFDCVARLVLLGHYLHAELLSSHQPINLRAHLSLGLYTKHCQFAILRGEFDHFLIDVVHEHSLLGFSFRVLDRHQKGLQLGVLDPRLIAVQHPFGLFGEVIQQQFDDVLLKQTDYYVSRACPLTQSLQDARKELLPQPSNICWSFLREDCVEGALVNDHIELLRLVRVCQFEHVGHVVLQGQLFGGSSFLHILNHLLAVVTADYVYRLAGQNHILGQQTLPAADVEHYASGRDDRLEDLPMVGVASVPLEKLFLVAALELGEELVPVLLIQELGGVLGEDVHTYVEITKQSIVSRQQRWPKTGAPQCQTCQRWTTRQWCTFCCWCWGQLLGCSCCSYCSCYSCYSCCSCCSYCSYCSYRSYCSYCSE